LHVKDTFPVDGMLGEGRVAAPPNENISIVQDLDAALGPTAQFVRV
jgi:hypothetical protein